MLVLNVAKSKLMLFFKSPKRPPKLTLTINGDIIEQVEEFNFLGITVDQNVNWDAHITKISIQLARVIGILHKLKRTFPQHILRTIYNSLINSSTLYLRTVPLGIKMQTYKSIAEESCKDSNF